MENKKTPNINTIGIGNDNNVNNKNNGKLKVKILFIHDLQLNIKDKKMNISDLNIKLTRIIQFKMMNMIYILVKLVLMICQMIHLF